MASRTIEIETGDGRVPCSFFHPDGDSAGEGHWPAILYYMDGMGIRPTLLQSAEAFAERGWCVLVPDLYYRGGDYPPFDHSTLQDDPAEQARIMELVALVTNEAIMRDTAVLLEFLEAQPVVRGRRIGCVGYCMGGPLALTAAGTFPDRVAAAASIHGANLATDRPDSPHLLAPEMAGEIYVAVAEHDPYIIPGETERIDEALREAGANYTLEVYEGAHHGFALVGAKHFDDAANERHVQQLDELFRRNLT